MCQRKMSDDMGGMNTDTREDFATRRKPIKNENKDHIRTDNW